MANYDPTLLQNDTRTSVHVNDRLNSPGHRPTKRKYLVLATALLTGLALVKTTVSRAFYQPGLPTGTQSGANFTVNDPNDPGDPTCMPASCSLRAAITAANLSSISGTQTIDFDLMYPVTITLSSPLPVITGTVVISGPGSANLTVSGNNLYRVFEVGSGASFDISSLAIRHGHRPDGGAGIYVLYGALSLSDCIVADNLSFDGFGGGGILSDFGTVQLNGCVVSDNSAGSADGGGLLNKGGQVKIRETTFARNSAFLNGAIQNNGVMTVTDSLFAGNTARLAAGIFNNGILTVTNSTFSDNIAHIASGGAIQNVATLVVANSTFFQNGADFGADIDNANGSAHVTNSTFYSTTSPSSVSISNAGISSMLVLSNTVLAAPSGIDNCSNMGGGSFMVSADNLATDNTCAGATVVTPGQLRLGALQDNGGSTPTVALLFASVALDAGNDAACAAPIGAPAYGAGGEDQRGVARPQGEKCDVGAFEQALLQHIFLPLILTAP